MIAFLFILLSVCCIILAVLFYYLHQRVEKMSKNQAIMVKWFDVLRDNQEILLKDIKKVIHEFQAFQKETRSK